MDQSSLSLDPNLKSNSALQKEDTSYSYRIAQAILRAGGDKESTVCIQPHTLQVRAYKPLDGVSKKVHLVESTLLSSESKDSPFSYLSERSLYIKSFYRFGEGPAYRYHEEGVLGEGATGKVYCVKDINCKREVAIKFLKSEVAKNPKNLHQFFEEAQLVAQLEHPNIIPVYNLDVDERGYPYLVMRRVRGDTLHSYIQNRIMNRPDPHIKNLNDLLEVILKVCDALSYAHTKGVYHQDIKPQNIMIGDYGEVFVIDWGAAVVSGEELALTPAYMSPQQAQNLPPTPADDVYGLGATLFHCLFLRLPTDGDTLGELWSKKENGVLDPLKEEEKRLVPPPLLAIILKALAADPQQRYSTPAEFAADLRNFQAGLAVSAYSDTLRDLFFRLLRKYRGILPGISLAFGMFILLSIFLWIQYVEERSGWGSPVFIERFEKITLGSQWTKLEGDFILRDGGLISIGNRSNILLYTEKLDGNMAISFDAKMLPGYPEGDLSLVWYPDLPNSSNSTKKNIEPIYFQLGAWDNTFARIKEKTTVSLTKQRLVSGQLYHIRVEIDGRFLRLFLNGKEICHYDRIFPINGGYFGLYAYYPGKWFDNIRIYSKQVASKVRITEVPDTYFQDGLYEHAIRYYERIVTSHASSLVADYAIYQKGLCWLLLNQKEKAQDTWKQIKNPFYREMARTHFLEQLFEQGRHTSLLQEFEEIWKDASPEMRNRLVILWGYFFDQLLENKQLTEAELYLQLRTKLFPKTNLHHPTLGHYFLRRGQYYRILENLPDEPWACAQALYYLGRYEEILERFPLQRGPASLALVRLGKTQEALSRFPERCQNILDELRRLRKWDEILSFFSDYPEAIAEAWIGMGKYEKVLENFSNFPHLCARALLAKNDLKGALEVAPHASPERALALLRSGKFQEVLHIKQAEPKVIFTALQRLGKIDESVISDHNFPEVIQIRALMHLGKFETVLELFPKYEDLCVAALGHLGRFHTIIEQYPNTIWGPPWAYSMQGRWREAFITGIDDPWIKIDYLQTHGQQEEILRQYPNYPQACSTALLYLGQYKEVLTRYPDQRDSCALALLYLKQPEEVLNLFQDLHDRVIEATYLQQLLLLEKDPGYLYPSSPLFSDRYVGFAGHAMFAHYLMPAIILQLQHGSNRAFAQCEYIFNVYNKVFNQRLWFIAGLILGKITPQEFLHQPYQHYIQADLILAQAIQKDLTNLYNEAYEYYIDYQNLPAYQRPLDPVSWYFVQWRTQRLKAQLLLPP